MSVESDIEDAVDVLQDLGLKEYEARCFVGLTRLDTGTAKRLAEVTAVPRTRVYDAVEVLESRGLVEVRHTTPRRFRAVSLAEAVATLRTRYDRRIDRLRETLERVDSLDGPDETPAPEVWSLRGRGAVAARSRELVSGAADEVVVVLGGATTAEASLLDSLSAVDDGVTVVVGAADGAVRAAVDESLPDATTFTDGLEWLDPDDGGPALERLLIVDRTTLLVSVVAAGEEYAVFGAGLDNGAVLVTHRLLRRAVLPEGSLAGGD